MEVICQFRALWNLGDKTAVCASSAHSSSRKYHVFSPQELPCTIYKALFCALNSSVSVIIGANTSSIVSIFFKKLISDIAMEKAIIIASLLALASCRTLVILENVLTKESHSSFLADLATKDGDIVYKYATDSSLTIKKYGESLYNNIIILAPSVAAFGNAVQANDFLTFLDDGGSIVMSASTDVGDPIKEIAAEVGIEIDDEGTSVIDHMNYDVSDVGNHDLIVADGFISASVIVGESPKPVLFKGVGMAADSDNPLVIDILRASPTAYSHAANQDILEYPLAIGSSLLLVAGMQARNNARIVVFGSHDMLSDKFYNADVKAQGAGGDVQAAGNKEFASNVVDWALRRNGDLRFSNVKHNKVKYLKLLQVEGK